MSDKCPKCGEYHGWGAWPTTPGMFDVYAGGVTVRNANEQATRLVGYQLAERACLERQLAQERTKSANLLLTIQGYRRQIAWRDDRLLRICKLADERGPVEGANDNPR